MENKACIKNRWVLLRDGTHWFPSPQICLSVQNTKQLTLLYMIPRDYMAMEIVLANDAFRAQ